MEHAKASLSANGSLVDGRVLTVTLADPNYKKKQFKAAPSANTEPILSAQSSLQFIPRSAAARKGPKLSLSK